jgi:hypothetical protein
MRKSFIMSSLQPTMIIILPVTDPNSIVTKSAVI